MDRRKFIAGAATVTALAVPAVVAAVYTPRPAHLSIEEYIKNDIRKTRFVNAELWSRYNLAEWEREYTPYRSDK